MKRVYFKEGEEVGQGTYWGIGTGARLDVTNDAIRLVEDSIRAHQLIVLGLAPVIGIVFAVFLPAIGMIMAGLFVGRKAWDGLKRLSLASFSLGWRPLEAYLSGRQIWKKKKGVRHE